MNAYIYIYIYIHIYTYICVYIYIYTVDAVHTYRRVLKIDEDDATAYYNCK
jgi:hypothetical protein